MSARPFVMAATLAVLVVGVVPPVLTSAALPDPVIHVDDGVVTRNRDVRLVILQPVSGNPVEHRISNVGATVNGMLTNYTTVIPQTDWWWNSLPITDPRIKWLDWTLPNVDGLTTIYAQSHYNDGTWSDVVSLDVRLDRSGKTSLYLDAEGDDSVWFDVWPGDDLHARHVAPADRIVATTGSATLGNRLTVKDANWQVDFVYQGTIAAGSYDVDGPGDGDCIEGCVEIRYVNSFHSATCTAADGTFDIAEITFDGSGDLLTMTADFNVQCFSRSIGGSIRYGSSAASYALDQDFEEWLYGQLLLGSTPSTKTLTLSNFGDVANQLGSASFSGPGAADWSIVSDSCSDVLLAVGVSCAVTIKPTPTVRGWRRAYLTIPDQTPRGQRWMLLEAEPVEQSAIAVSAPIVPTEAGPARFEVTVAPPPSFPCAPRLYVDGSEQTKTGGVSPDPGRALWFANIAELPIGTHTISASYSECDYLLASGPVSITVTNGQDSEPPTGTMAIDQDYTKDESISIYTPASDEDSEMAKVAFSNDGESWAEYPYAAHNAWSLPIGQYGVRTVYAKFSDAFGNWSEVVSDTVVYDVVPPTVTPPTQQFVEGSSVNGGKVVVNVPWSASDGLSGIYGYSLNQKTDNGAWKNVFVPTAITNVTTTSGGPSVDRQLAPAHKYTFRVKATDLAANPSGWAAGPTVNLKKLQESSSLIRYKGTWSTPKETSFWGGAAKRSTKPGSSATMTFTGRSVAWVSRVGPTRGRAAVYVDGVLDQTVDLWASSVGNQRVVWERHWSTRGSHSIKVVLLTTTNRPIVEIDAFLTGE